MKAILCRSFGGPETLVIDDVPAPSPGPAEALVRVHLTALNFFDTLIIEDKYQLKPPLPFSPGAEFCGTVEALGPGTEGLKVGERVIGSIGYGACRELVTARADRLTRVPEGVTDEQAAGLTITYGTSLHALKDRAQVRPGETLAVLGAAGGVGLAAVEIGKLLGARVVACASSDDKLAIAREHGADETLNYARESLREGLRRLTGDEGVDVLYDPVGGDLAEPGLRSMAWKGRYLVIGFAGGRIPKIPLNLVLLKGCDVQGVFWGSFVDREPAAHAANMAWLLGHVASGGLSARVHGVYPLAETPAALGILARREATGKVLVRP
ncbi:MAG TPA: NADPH:quinone oxidoreductase family protein [Beijerinckiaceae bacterium]|jgi:NADPH2:quinone reductase